jgi:[ribosomal protein S18]-alanine N-acetyltransferase
MTAAMIRPMRAGDVNAARGIAAAAQEAPHWGEAEYLAYLTAGENPQLVRTAFVAEAEGRVAGFAAATLLLDGVENRCELDTMAVDPGLRRRGLGRALLEAVLGWAMQGGALRMGLEVRASNAAALALYRRMGFAEESRRVGYYRDPVEDALVLTRVVTRVSSAGSISTDKDVEGRASQC